MLRNFNTTAEILRNSKRCSLYVNSCLRWKSDDVVVRIKDVSKRIKSAKNPQYVPRKYLMKEPSQETLKHLRWMLQKDILNQDIFLMGSPGSKRRELALAFLELTQRELEFVSLSRDTTEADLKQRREIQNATANYYDQSAVRAAIHGRILVLEGVEKAERNVLPILNNLLENREMHLEDGRFLIPAARYDKLLKEHSKEELDAWRLVRVDEDFRVIALGLPVPKYSGHSLDPPLRSRFQARLIPAATFKEQLEDLQNSMPTVDSHKLSQLLSSCHALVTPEAVSLGLPDFPLENIKSVVEILDKFPETPVYDLFYRLYPYKLFLNKEGKSAVEDILTTFGILEKRRKSEGNNKKKIIRCEKNEEMKYFASAKILNNDGMEKSYNVLCGTNSQERKSKYIGTTYQDNLLTDMMESHLSSDLCLIGPKGCGKSITVEQLANLLGYEVDPILLYQDMTSRDLIQQRSTLENGDTVWKNSPLVEAALNGKLAILDGIHRIHPSTLAIIHRLVQNRELQLHDGKRLLRHDRYDEIKEEYQKSDDDMKNDGILRIHPAFRLIALAEPVAANSNNAIGSWLNSELLSLFLFHEMRPLSKNEELDIIREKFGEPSESLFNIINLAHDLRSSKDSTLQSLSNSLSTRQLLRIARRLKAYPDDDTHDLVNRTCLARFLPAIPKQALEDSLKKHRIVQELKTRSAQAGVKQIQCLVTDDTVSIGKTTVERNKTQNLTKVPDILFYDMDQHLRLLEKLMQDFILGENLLLVGNQGVGKNKIVDRLLQVLNRPREYIQLHRDTTVQTLTIQTMVKNGIVVYEDSPLVQAVKFGHVLVIDEADKAPTQVTCILKTLVESGEMTLSDGRRIVPATTAGQTTAPNLIQMHPDFRLIVLANRPGFPFLGNDFFGALGDLFSTHSVDNPSVEDEIQLLRQYGPDVDQEMIQKLVRAFGELRSMSDQGLVSYPYSTREVVNIVRHLQKFPDEPLTNVVRNVFDFDRYSDEVFETLVSILHKHGIPLGANISNVALAKEISLPARLQHLQTWKISENPRVIPVEEKFVKFKAPNYFKTNIHNLDRFESRSVWFTELISHWNVPVHQISTVAGLAISKSKGSDADEKIHVLTASATSDVFSIFSMSRNSQEIREIFIHNLIRPLKGDLPGYTLVSDENGNLLIHEKTSNSLFSLNLEEGFIREFQLSSFFDSAGDKFAQAFRSSRNVDWKFQSTSDPRFAVIFGAEKLEFLDLHKMNVYSMTLPFQIRSVLQVSDRSWLVQDSSSKNYLLSKASDDLACPNILNPIDSIETRSEIDEFLTCNRQDLVHEAPDLESNPFQAPNRILATEKTYVTLLRGFPDSKEAQVEVHSVRKKEEASISSLFQPIVTPAGLLIRGVGTKGIPESVVPQDQRNRFLGSLEFVDPVRNKARYVPVPKPESVSQATQWLYTRHLPFYAALASNQDLVTVDAGGTVRLWETSSSSLSRSLDAWQKMVGADTEKLQLTKERHSGLETSRPKHGRVDEKNDPHVGGNTWAGGTGGRDTAGLGGKGGPYRLDAGHDVHQLSDEEKRAVPEHIQKAAREMGQRTFRQRLQEIQMSEYDHNLYQQFSKPVQRQVQAIRILLGNLQAKSKEREWCRNQTSGELDDTKLIEGLTGEKTIYKRRAEKEPEIGAPQLRPKRLKLVVDVSGSMYRFNGYDARLDREIEAAVMVMEAFNDYEDKIQYDIVGHSGDEYHIPFVDHTKPPKDSKRRLEIVKTMHAHSQFCMSGDHTLEATQHAIQSLAKEETDESIVVVLSDANLERYGIPPEKFAKILTSNPEVNAFAIFIGSLGDQADRLVKRMPSRKAFVCMDLKNIPRILQQIFAASVLSTTRSN